MICKINVWNFLLLVVCLEAFLLNYSVLGQQAQSKINYDAGIELAQKLAIEGKYEVSRLVCHRILQDVPEYYDAYFIIGNTYAWDRQFEKARLFYNKVFEFNNGDINAFNQLIAVELWDGNPVQAINLAIAALEFEPNSEEILYKKARAHVMLGDFMEVKRSIFLILSKNPSNSEALQLYNKVLDDVPIEILIDDQEIIFLEPIDSLFKKARNYAYSEYFHKAFEVIDQIIQDQPSYLPAYVLKAQTYAWVNKYDIAREIVGDINNKDCKFKPAVLTAIDIELWSEHYRDAIELCNYFELECFPEDPEILFRKAEAHKALSEYYLAKKIIHEMMYMDAGNSRALQYYNELVDSEERYQRDYLDHIRSEKIEQGFNKDSLLETARELTFDRRFEEAQSICFEVLGLFPNDYDAKHLLGMGFAWMGKYEIARKIFNSILQTTFDSFELISSMIDLEIWDHQYDKALNLVEYGLDIYPNERSLLLKKAMIYQRTNKSDLATIILKKLLSLYPEDRDLQKSYFAMKGLIQLNAIGAGYSFSSYSEPSIRRWHMFSSSYYHTNEYGSFIGKVNSGYVAHDKTNFMEGGGVQFEIDAYPVIPEKKRYFYLNYGYSPNKVFARHRFGVNIYQDISNGWEYSAGLNYNYYKNSIDTTHVFIFRVGVNKYWNSIMAGIGYTMAPSFGRLSHGYSLIARKFLNRPDNWIQVILSAGIYPDNPLFYLNESQGSTPGLLQSYTINSGCRYLIGYRLIGQLFVGYQRQEYMPSFNRNSLILNLSLIYLFKETF